MNLEQFNQFEIDVLETELMRCCGSQKWAQHLIVARPFDSLETLYKRSDAIWHALHKEEWLEAFRHHPKIGDLESLRTKFGSTSEWAEGEQSAVAQAEIKVLEDLAKGNKAYEDKFGYIFIVCATGKTAEQMLDLLEERLENDPEVEIHIAMEEQNKITRLRLEKLLA